MFIRIFPDLDRTQIGRASSLLFASLKFASMLKNETLSPEEFRGNKLCMDQFKSLFGSCRIPCGDKDIVETDPLSSHVVVMKRNCMYYFQGLWPEDGSVAVTRHDIVEILHAIEKDAQEHHGNPETLASQAFGVLTTMERRAWAKARQEMSSFSAHNHAALIILVLDDFIPKTVDEAVSNMLHGTHQLHQSSENMKQYQVNFRSPSLYSW
jgi:carnitine O-acetyltransferase